MRFVIAAIGFELLLGLAAMVCLMLLAGCDAIQAQSHKPITVTIGCPF